VQSDHNNILRTAFKEYMFGERALKKTYRSYEVK